MKAKIKTTKPVPDFTAVRFDAVARPIVERWAQVALAQVRAEWPVDSGTSKLGWTVTTEIRGDSAKIVLLNPVPYAIHVTKKGSDTELAQPLANRILAEVTAKMDVEISKALAAAFDRATVTPRRR